MSEYNADYKKVWFETFTGAKVFPFDLDPATIDIQDIAHALSMKCRFGGHSRIFYSVAEHCDRAMRLITQEFVDGILAEKGLCDKIEMPVLKLFTFLHDGAEAYLPDLIRPIKNHVPFLVEAEKDIIVKICVKFVGREPTTTERLIIKQADNIMLLREAKALMKNTDGWELYGIESAGELKSPYGKMTIWAKYDYLKEFEKLVENNGYKLRI